MKRIFIVLVLLLTLTTLSHADLGLKSVAPQIGVIFPENPFNTGFEIGVTANMGEFAPSFALFPLINYWSAGGGEGIYDWSFSNFQIGADAHYYVKDLPGFFAGAGLTLNFMSISSDYDVPGFGPVSASVSETKVGFGLVAGYEMPIDKYKGFVKGKYNLISDVNTFELAIGLHFDIK